MNVERPLRLPSHSVRILDEVWEPARMVSHGENETVTGVVHMLLMDYALRGEERAAAVVSIGDGAMAARCSYCHAVTGEPCKDPSGRGIEPHALRVERSRRLAVQRRQAAS